VTDKQQQPHETLDQKTARLRALRLERDRTQPAHRDPPRNYRALGLHDEMPFGQYEGKTIEELIDDEPGYVKWLLENLRDFELAPDAEAYWNQMGHI
jgi:hypothetical protein